MKNKKNKKVRKAKNAAFKAVRDARGMLPIAAVAAQNLRERDARLVPAAPAAPLSEKRAYAERVVCMLVISLMAVWRNGTRAGMIIAVCLLCSVFADFICCRMRKLEYSFRDLSTFYTGFCLAFLMPSDVPATLCVFGAALAIGVKHIFGGRENYVFTPAAVSAAFLIIGYPAQMVRFPDFGVKPPLFLSADSVLPPAPSPMSGFPALDVLLGRFAGAIGTTHILVISVCAVCLFLRRAASYATVISAVGTSLFGFLLTGGGTFGFETRYLRSVWLFGIVFLASDPQVLPKTKLGRVYYGVCLGLAETFFANFGKVEHTFIFALLFAQAFATGADKLAQRTRLFITKMGILTHKTTAAFEQARETQVSQVLAAGDTRELDFSVQYTQKPYGAVTKIRKKHGVFSRLRMFWRNLSKTVKKTATHLRELPAHVLKNDKRDDTPVVTKENISFAKAGFSDFTRNARKIFKRLSQRLTKKGDSKAKTENTAENAPSASNAPQEVTEETKE